MTLLFSIMPALKVTFRASIKGQHNDSFSLCPPLMPALKVGYPLKDARPLSIVKSEFQGYNVAEPRDIRFEWRRRIPPR